MPAPKAKRPMPAQNPQDLYHAARRLIWAKKTILAVAACEDLQREERKRLRRVALSIGVMSTCLWLRYRFAALAQSLNITLSDLVRPRPSAGQYSSTPQAREISSKPHRHYE